MSSATAASDTAELKRRLLARMLEESGVAAGAAARGIPRASADRDALPLSFAQQRIWFFHRLAPTSAVYNVAGAARMRGALDVAALQHSLDAVVRRHESLRTTFGQREGRPVQCVNPPRPLTVPRHDLREVPAAERGRAVEALIGQEVARPFDLEHGQMLRPTLFRLAADEHLLLLVQHHIATDGWSLNVLLREIGVLYQAAVLGHDATLPDLAVQYADFAAWQRDELVGDTLERQLSYWRRRLDGARPLRLPAARPLTAARSWEGGASSFRVGPDLVRRITDLANAENATPYMVLLAAYALVLSRRSGQADVIVGSPMANRGRSETEGIVGCFVNTLPLRVAVAGELSFRELLARAREACLGAYDHQEVPFEKIVEDLNPERDPTGRTPLIRHMLGLHNLSRPRLELPGVRVELVGIGTGKARFDLELELAPAPDGGLDGLVWYAVDLFGKEDVDYVTDALLAVLESAVRAPDAPVRRLPVVGPRERAVLLQAVGEPAGETTEEPHWAAARVTEGSVDAAATVAAPTAPDPELPAVLDDGDERVWSHRDLWARAGRLAGLLADRGAGPGVPVLVTLRPSAWAVAALLAVRASGAVAVPVDARHADAQLRAVGARHGARLVVADREVASDVARGVPVIRVPLDERAEPPEGAAPAGFEGSPTAAGTVWERNRSDRLVHWLTETLADEVGGGADRTGGADDGNVVAVAGAPLLEDVEAVLRWAAVTGAVLDFVGSGSATTLYTTPSLLARSLDGTVPAALRRVLCAGEELWPALIERVEDRLPGVGLFEVRRPAGDVGELLVRTGVGRVDRAAGAGGGALRGRVPWRVLDEHGQATPLGVSGLLHLAADGASTGIGDGDGPDATADVLAPDPLAAGPRLRRTAERALIRPDGGVELLGPRGVGTAAELRAGLLAHPAVDRAVVLPPGDDPRAHRAYVTLRRPVDRDPRRVADDFLAAYVERVPEADPLLGAAGWTPYGGSAPVAAPEMRAWIEETAARVLDFEPARVLEIGCRSGYLLFRVAPRCAEYWATDASARGLAHIRDHKDRLGAAAETVRVSQRMPHDMSELPQAHFDVVVIPALAAYLPDRAYLERVLAAAVRAARPGGVVLVTDVPRLGLVPAFAAEGAAAGTPAPVLAGRIDAWRELAAEPALFAAWAERTPRVVGVTAWAKAGDEPRALTAYRYDVVIQVGDGDGAAGATAIRFAEAGAEAGAGAGASAGADASASADAEADGGPEPTWPETTWPADGGTDDLRHLLAGRPERLLVRGIPDGRLAAAGPSRQTPASLAASARAAGYVADFAAATEPGVLDLALRRAPEGGRVRRDGPPDVLALSAPGGLAEFGGPGDVVHEPGEVVRVDGELARLRAHLLERVPDLAERVELVAVRRWPLGPGGVLAPAALPAPDAGGARPDAEPTAPRTETEAAVARIWADVLGIDRVGVEEDFFSLGGHSLMAAELADRVQQALSVDLPLARLFDTPTVAGVAEYVDGRRAEAAAPSRSPIGRIDRDRHRRKDPA